MVLVTLDTFRADRIGAYGAEGVSTPALDALAGEAVLFENATAPMPLTVPSHLSILTGRYPREHGVVNHGMALPDEEVSLAETLRDHGYRTGAFVAVTLLSPEAGADQGFERFSGPQGQQRPASSVVSEALAWVATVPADEPYFLWVHLFDTHLPYAPPPAWRSEALAASEGRWPSLHWRHFERAAQRHGGDVPAAMLEHAKRLYDAEIEYTDHWVGKLLEGLRGRGRWRDSAVAVTADHGECFDNGIYFEHADCLFQGAVRVPLFVAWPGRPRAGERVSAQASLVDVAPTLLEAAGLPPLPGQSGVDLGELGAAPPERAVLVQHPLYVGRDAAKRESRHSVIESVAGVPRRPARVSDPQVGVVTPEWKYLWSRSGEELYHLGREPDEATNLAAERARIRGRLRRALRDLLAGHPARPLVHQEMSEELREALEALGYL